MLVRNTVPFMCVKVVPAAVLSGIVNKVVAPSIIGQAWAERTVFTQMFPITAGTGHTVVLSVARFTTVYCHSSWFDTVGEGIKTPLN
jgi:hypothetical protein